MGKLFLAGLGGFIGSSVRYAMTGYVQHWNRNIDFPYGTLVVNLIGCFLIGFLSQLAESRGVFSADTRTFVFVGILGGFTTFSAFGNETLNLWREGANTLAIANIAAHLILGLGAVWVSRLLAYQIWA